MTDDSAKRGVRLLYDEPVRVLMKEMADDLASSPNQSFTRQDAVVWFEKNYPEVKIKTVVAHLIRLSTNTRTRMHYNATQDDDVLFKIDRNHFRRYDEKNDPPAIHERPVIRVKKTMRVSPRLPRGNRTLTRSG